MIQNGVLTVTETYWINFNNSVLVSVRGLPMDRNLWYIVWLFLLNSTIDKGLGELLIGCNFGILAVLGAYYDKLKL